MNLLLSLFLCLAVMLGGAELPEVAETATQWTLRDVVVVDGEEEISVEPAFTLTGALGTGGGTLHFEAAQGDKVLLPLTAALTPDALRFSFGAHERTYMLSDAELLNVLGESLEASMGDVFPPSTLAGMFGDYTLLYGYGEEPLGGPADRVLREILGEDAEATEVELDGEVLAGEKRSYTLTEAELPALLDALRTCGEPRVEVQVKAMLNFESVLLGEAFESFAEFAAAEPFEPFAFALNLTTAEHEDVQYVRIETEQQSPDGETSSLWQEIVRRGEVTEERATSTLRGQPRADDLVTDSQTTMAAQITGPLDAPERLHVEYDFASQYRDPAGATSGLSWLDTMLGIVQYRDPEGTTSGGEGLACRFTLDSETRDGLGSGRFVLESVSGELPDLSLSDLLLSPDVPTPLELTWVERPGDGATSRWDVALALGATSGESGLPLPEGELLRPGEGVRGVRFTLERAEAPAEDPLVGTEEIELSDEVLSGEGDEQQRMYIAAAQSADVTRFNLDATKLRQDPGLSALFPLPEYEIESEEEIDDVYERVETLEEAAAIYEGELPKYAPPEGYALDGIWASPRRVDLHYVSEERSFELSCIRLKGDDHSESYTISGGELIPEENYYVELDVDSDGTVFPYIDVYSPDGSMLHFYFDTEFNRGDDQTYFPTVEEVRDVLRGLG